MLCGTVPGYTDDTKPKFDWVLTCEMVGGNTYSFWYKQESSRYKKINLYEKAVTIDLANVAVTKNQRPWQSGIPHTDFINGLEQGTHKGKLVIPSVNCYEMKL